MAKRVGDEMKNEVLQVVERPGRNQDCENQSVETVLETETQHPYAFHVSGPRNVPSINWRDLINSTWKDGNYKRTVIACFIQAVYLLELDRQENRTSENALAPKWWIPFKYKLVETLIDERDGSQQCVHSRPFFRSWLCSPSRKSTSQRRNIRGGTFVQSALRFTSFMSKKRGGKSRTMWKRVKSMLPASTTEPQANINDRAKSTTLGSKQWVPHLYVNNSDYICCYYTDPVGTENSDADKENAKPVTNTPCAAKLFVFSKGKQKFLEAHGLAMVVG
ncbi:UNVERIFIED_CONTAM: hypothetical protein Scaly_1209000 [Sesamum calycinum]|uniref:Uncharacterized protein n=1 Tax=Sesamum calycinum TaxID=2727403 RepID=A0AAW2Q477_9LAMI